MAWSPWITPTPVSYTRSTDRGDDYYAEGTASAAGTSFNSAAFTAAWEETVDAVEVVDPTTDTTAIRAGWASGANVTGTLGAEVTNYIGRLERLTAAVDLSTALHNFYGEWPEYPPGGPWDVTSDLYGSPYAPGTVEYQTGDATVASGGQVRVGVYAASYTWNSPVYPDDAYIVTIGGTSTPTPLEVVSYEDEGTIVFEYTWSGVTLTADGPGYVGAIDLDLSERVTDDEVRFTAESKYQSEIWPFGGTGASLLFGGRLVELYTRFYSFEVDVNVQLPAYRYWVPVPGVDIKFPDGQFRTTGASSDQPLKVLLPTGWETWPGSTRPLYLRTHDGWRRIG